MKQNSNKTLNKQKINGFFSRRTRDDGPILSLLAGIWLVIALPGMSPNLFAQSDWGVASTDPNKVIQRSDTNRSGSILGGHDKSSQEEAVLVARSKPNSAPPNSGFSSGTVIPATPPQGSSAIPYVPLQENGAEVSETLEAAQERAVSLSRQLQAKNLKADSAREKVRAARGIALPKFSNTTVALAINEEPAVKSEADLSKLLPIPPIQINTPISEKEFVTSVTSVTIPLYLGGRVRAMIESASALTTALESGVRIEEQDLRFKVAETYFLVLRVKSILHIAQVAEQTAAAHLKDAKRYYENGLVTKNVVLAAEVAQSNAQQDVIKSQNAYQLAQAVYNRLLWRDLRTPVSLVEIDVPETSPDLESLTATAIRTRHELTALAAESQALAAQGRVQHANVMPQVALVGAHTCIDNKYISPNSNFVGAVGMTWTPFDGGTSRAMRDSANLDALGAAKRYEDARTAIELQVYQSWLNEQETRSRILVAKQATRSADENLRVVNRSFREGLVNHTEVLDAQTLRTAAWTRYAHARFDAIVATFQLRHATGNL